MDRAILRPMVGGCRRGGFAALRPTASQCPAVTTDDSASFLLPGLVHQFGNILLTVQGNLMHLDGADLERVQADVLSAAKRGGGSLQVMRCLLNAGSLEPTLAQDLLRQVVDLGSVAARERGLALAIDTEGADPFWAPAMPFVQLCCATMQAWVTGVPAGAEGRIEITATGGADSPYQLQVRFGAASSSLSFPLELDQICERIQHVLPNIQMHVEVETDGDAAFVRIASANSCATWKPPAQL